MAIADKSIAPRILESAKQEFMEYGFERASLKVICEKAGVTTGALYKRYKGKEELFCAVVEETVKELDEIAEQKGGTDLSSMTNKELYDTWEMDNAYMLWWFQFLYDRKDCFVLLISQAQGTRYSNFQHDWVEKMTGSTYAYYQEARKRGIAQSDISLKEMHVLTSAFWATIYEPFIHDFSWEEIEEHSNRVCELINWHRALKFRKDV